MALRMDKYVLFSNPLDYDVIHAFIKLQSVDQMIDHLVSNSCRAAAFPLGESLTYGAIRHT